MKRWLDDIVNFIYPAVCHICDIKLAPYEKFICRKCVAELPRTGFHREDLNPMAERFAGLFPFEQATGIYFYDRDSGFAHLIQDMKYRSFPDIGKRLGKMAVEELYSTGFFSDIEFVTPVPMHWLKKAQRGYNQAEMIARGIAEEANMEYIESMAMTRRHKTQTRLSREERLKNAEGLFRIRKNVNLQSKKVLLIDDICTTGTTLSEAAITLCKAFPEIKLSLLTMGVTF